MWSAAPRWRRRPQPPSASRARSRTSARRTCGWPSSSTAAGSRRAPPRAPKRAAIRTFGPRTPEGVTRVFLVRRRVADARCAAAWYQVDLPIRPNGVRGWVPAAGLKPYVVRWRIRVELGRRRLIAYESGRERLRLTVAVGTPSTPTPTGSFYVFERLHLRNPKRPVRPGRAGPLELLPGADRMDARRARRDPRHRRAPAPSATPSRTAACACATSRCGGCCASCPAGTPVEIVA